MATMSWTNKDRETLELSRNPYGDLSFEMRDNDGHTHFSLTVERARKVAKKLEEFADLADECLGK